MPRYNVEADGKWSCFSSITDSFLCPFMEREEYEKIRENTYGKDNIPLGRANQMSLKRAIFCLSLNKTDDQIIENLRFAGLIDDPDEEREVIKCRDTLTLTSF